MTNPQEQHELVELTGAYDWEMVVKSFKEMTIKEIEDECNNMWPQEEGNGQFAKRVYEAVNQD